MRVLNDSKLVIIRDYYYLTRTRNEIRREPVEESCGMKKENIK